MRILKIIEVNVFLGRFNSKEVRRATGCIFQGKCITQTATFGINVMRTEDRSVGFAGIEDSLKYWFKIMRWRFLSFRRAIVKLFDVPMYRRMTLACGKVGDVWMSKFGMTDDQGLREQHNMFVNMEARGKLNEAEDREVWEPLRKKYGRNYVWDGSKKYEHLRGQAKVTARGI